MNSNNCIPRLLGAAFLFVLVASITASSLSILTLLSGSISDSFVNISNNLMQIRISILVELLTSVGIVVLAVLLFVVLHKQNKTIALVALGLWLAEAVILAVSKIGTFALIPLSLEYVKAGAPDSSYFQTLGTLFFGVDRWGYDIHMLFFGLGGILWYYLFYRSKYIPRVLSVWGILAVSLALIGTLLVIFDLEPMIILVIPNGLFELTIGLWLVLKGIRLYKIES
jgi:hypothetical protein